MAWLQLLVAGLLEVAWVITMKKSMGFTRPGMTVITVICMIGSFALLSRVLLVMPVGTAYAIWTGIGAAGAAVAGIFLFSEPVSMVRMASIGLIVLGLLGLRLSAGH